MIPRYSRKEIESVWSQKNKFSIWLEIECHVAKKQSIDGIIPKKASQDINRKASFDVKEIEKIEKETKHDFVAFINNVSNKIGENAKYFHHGLTSSDVIDTAFSIQLRKSAELIIKEIIKLLNELKIKSLKYKKTPMIGRSHGIHAEPITFGIKMASFYLEFKRNLERLKIAKDEISICAISGPVGTYNSVNPSIEKYVAKKMNLTAETLSTQIIPRDRHAFFFATLGILASSIEKLAIEIRHLQRTEIYEVEEFFSKKQKGSSAMPHKRNPILSENLTGLARYIRSAVIPSMENIAVWHERDISHSSVERIIAPDVTIASDFAISRMTEIVKKLKIYPAKMINNIEKLNGLHNSQKILLALIQKGMSRMEAYEIIQLASKKVLNSNKTFKEIVFDNKKITKIFNKREINNFFKKDNLKYIEDIFNKIF